MRKIKWISFVILILSLCLAAGCINAVLVPPARSKSLAEETLVKSDRFWTSHKVLLVDVDGILTDAPYESPSLFAQSSALVHIKDYLKKAEDDPSIKAVLFRVNSPGGTVTASDLIFHEIQEFKKKTGKKVVVHFLDLGASGAYYMAMAADQVIASPTTITGSIGVVALFPEIQGLSDKIGLSMRVIKSGQFKDLGSLWRSFSEPERSILQTTVNSMHERFVKIVAEGRKNLSLEQVRELADGRIYTADQAKELGLVDSIGYMDDAFDAAKALASIQDASMVTYSFRYGYVGHYYATAPGAPLQSSTSDRSLEVNLLRLDGRLDDLSSRTPFHYLWIQ